MAEQPINLDLESSLFLSDREVLTEAGRGRRFAEGGRNPIYYSPDQPASTSSSLIPKLEDDIEDLYSASPPRYCDEEPSNSEALPVRSAPVRSADKRRFASDDNDDDDPNDDGPDEPAIKRHKLHQHDTERHHGFEGDPDFGIKPVRHAPSSVLEYEHIPLIMEQWSDATELLKQYRLTHCQIRLLDLAPSSDPTSKIRCTLRHVYIDENPVYKAVSYVWGDPNETLPISVDGRKYQVTINCHAVLQRLRLEKEPVCLWIDSICINQRDLGEKSFQIVLMRDIYSQAEEVFVWLGKPECWREPNDEAEEVNAITLVKDLSRSPEVFDNPEAFTKVATEGNAAARWKALAKTLQHPWFHRLWVHQEIVVAKRARVLGLSYCIGWEFITVAALAIEQHVKYWDPLAESVDNNEAWSSSLKTLISQAGHMNVLRRCWPQWFYDRDKKEIAKVSLLQLLQNTRHYQCINPLDKCFAIFGLVSTTHLDSFMLHPDYGLRVTELYTYLAWFIIRGTGSLEILCLAGLGNSNPAAEPKLPSWVVDWREDGIKQPSRLDYSIYDAGTCNYSPAVSFNVHELTLKLSGQRIGTIKFIQKEDGGDFWRSSGLSKWRELFPTRRDYPAACSPTEAWIRTITCDIGYDDGQERRMSDGIVAQIQTLLNIDKLACEEIEKAFPKTDPEVDDADWQAAVMKVGADFVRIASRATSSRAFFISGQGYMGIGPLDARKGDKICLFPGCRVPLLVRSETHVKIEELDDSNGGVGIDSIEESVKHFVVGECFVWGLMNKGAIAPYETGLEEFTLC